MDGVAARTDGSYQVERVAIGLRKSPIVSPGERKFLEETSSLGRPNQRGQHQKGEALMGCLMCRKRSSMFLAVSRPAQQNDVSVPLHITR